MTNQLNLFSEEHAYKEKDIKESHPVVHPTPVVKQPAPKIIKHPVINTEIPIENPTIDIADQFVDEAFETVDTIIDVVDDYIEIPQSVRKKINWFKRKAMWAKRLYKKYRVWWHKLGKLELDPKIRSEFRSQRQQTTVLYKKVTAALDLLDINRKDFDAAVKSLEQKTHMIK